MIQAADTDGDGRIDYEGGRTDGVTSQDLPAPSAPRPAPPGPAPMVNRIWAVCAGSSVVHLGVEPKGSPLSGADPIS